MTKNILAFNFLELSNIRRYKGISQKELGRRVGVSDATIRNYERNPKSIPVGTLFDIAAALGVSASELIKIRGCADDQSQSLL